MHRGTKMRLWRGAEMQGDVLTTPGGYGRLLACSQQHYSVGYF